MACTSHMTGFSFAQRRDPSQFNHVDSYLEVSPSLHYITLPLISDVYTGGSIHYKEGLLKPPVVKKNSSNVTV